MPPVPPTLNELVRNLQYFNLSDIEANIIGVLLSHGSLSAKQICPLLPSPSSKTSPKIYRSLKRLVGDGWLQILQEKPKIYTLSLKKHFQETMELIITKTQQQFEHQKESAYQILDALKEFELKDSSEFESDTKTKSKKANSPKYQFDQKVLDKYPAPIGQWLSSFGQSQWDLIKSESNIGIAIKEGEIRFKMNSGEFKTQNSPLHFAGFLICELDTPEDVIQNMKDIHQYNSNMLKMAYKMEKKKFVDHKTERGLKEYVLHDPEEEAEKLSTKFHLTGHHKYSGELCSIIANSTPYLVGYWAEDPQDLNVIKKEIEKLLPLLKSA